MVYIPIKKLSAILFCGGDESFKPVKQEYRSGLFH